MAQPRGPLAPTWGAATLSYVVPDWTLLPRPVSAGVCTILGCHLPPAPGGSLLPLLGSFSDFQIIVRVRKQLCFGQPSSVPTVLPPATAVLVSQSYLLHILMGPHTQLPWPLIHSQSFRVLFLEPFAEQLHNLPTTLPASSPHSTGQGPLSRMPGAQLPATHNSNLPLAHSKSQNLALTHLSGLA